MTLKLVADIPFPTAWADFRLMGFEETAHADGKELSKPQSLLALVLGDILAAAPLVRIHSQCTTGDVFHSLRCDCHDQLHLALYAIARAGCGILVYEHQEGRGIGLLEKLKAYALQDTGLDTIEANLQLGHAVDLRDYQLPVEVLRFLKVPAIRMMTNNPQKLEAVLDAGIAVVERVSAEVPANRHNAAYLRTKRERLGHFHTPLLEDEPSAAAGLAGLLQACVSPHLHRARSAD